MFGSEESIPITNLDTVKPRCGPPLGAAKRGPLSEVVHILRVIYCRNTEEGSRRKNGPQRGNPLCKVVYKQSCTVYLMFLILQKSTKDIIEKGL